MNVAAAEVGNGPSAAQEEFGEFFEAPAKEEVKGAAVQEINKEETKRDEKETRTEKKESIWDEAQDMLGMDDLMKPADNQFRGGNLHGALYGTPNPFKY